MAGSEVVKFSLEDYLSTGLAGDEDSPEENPVKAKKKYCLSTYAIWVFVSWEWPMFVFMFMECPCDIKKNFNL